MSKEELEELYNVKKLSTAEISKILGVSKDKVLSMLDENEIPRRSTSESLRVKYENIKSEREREARDELSMILTSMNSKEIGVKYNPPTRDNLLVSVPLNLINDKHNPKEVVLTAVISDLHLGDSDHLPNTYWSSIANLIRILDTFKESFTIKHFNLILNGDIVSGREVYRFQSLRNLLQRGHWQVFLSEIVLRNTFAKIEKSTKINSVFALKGTHESLGENYILYLKRVLDNKVKYLGHSGIVNIGYPLGNYNILVTHGSGKSDYYPVSGEILRDLWKALAQNKVSNVPIERFCLGHSHWLTTNLEMEGITVDVTGGFQRWEKTVSQRPSGLILYIFHDNEVSAIPVKPDPNIELKEKNESGLEYKNLRYYGESLLKHLKDVENIEM